MARNAVVVVEAWSPWIMVVEAVFAGIKAHIPAWPRPRPCGLGRVGDRHGGGGPGGHGHGQD